VLLVSDGAATRHGYGGAMASCAVVPVTVPGFLGRLPRMLADREGLLFLRWSRLWPLARDMAEVHRARADHPDHHQASVSSRLLLSPTCGRSLSRRAAMARCGI
jgi:D-amino-acid dehydrogenase